jgi:hypothetical protein
MATLLYSKSTGKFVIGGRMEILASHEEKLLLTLIEEEELMVVELLAVRILKKLTFCCLCCRHIAKNMVAAGIADEF